MYKYQYMTLYMKEKDKEMYEALIQKCNLDPMKDKSKLFRHIVKYLVEHDEVVQAMLTEVRFKNSNQSDKDIICEKVQEYVDTIRSIESDDEND